MVQSKTIMVTCRNIRSRDQSINQINHGTVDQSNDQNNHQSWEHVDDRRTQQTDNDHD